MNIKNERRCTHHMHTTLLSVEKTQKACKTVCIKAMIIQLLFHTVTLTQLDLYLQCTSGSFSSSLLNPPDNNLSIPPTLNILPHFWTLSPQLSGPSPFNHNTGTSPQVFAIGQDSPEMKATGLFDWIIQGNVRETSPSLYVSTKIWVSSFPRLACLLHQTKTWLNSHFRCAGAFSTSQIAY